MSPTREESDINLSRVSRVIETSIFGNQNPEYFQERWSSSKIQEKEAEGELL